MISASTEFLEKINNGDTPLMQMALYVTGRDEPYTISDGQFWGNSISFSEATSQDGSFDVGSAVIGSFSFSLNNFDRTFDGIDFRGAIVVPLIYFTINGTNEYVAKGIYYISSHTTSGNIIRCTALDGMKLLDNSATTITYPTTVQSLVETICTANGITLGTTTIPNGSFALEEPTDATSNNTVMTDRQKLSYACQCIGCYAKMDENGALVVDWYDFDNPIEITTTFDGKSLFTSPIAVTGIRADISNASGSYIAVSLDTYGNLIYIRSDDITDTMVLNSDDELVITADSSVTYTLTDGVLYRTAEESTSTDEESSSESASILYGTDEWVVSLGSNPYITLSNVNDVFANVSENIFAIHFRPGTLPVLGNPCLQAGDVLQVTDRYTDTVYLFPITSTIYNKSITQNVICAFEDKEDADLRPTSNYNLRVTVESAIAQAQQADALAQAAQELAETSGYQPYIVSDKGTAFTQDTTATLTAVIYDKDMNEVDPDGTTVIYRWWITKDGTQASYLDGGKILDVPISDALCDYAAGIYFETKDISEGVNPFLLARRSDSVILTTRDGTPLSVRGAEEYG